MEYLKALDNKLLLIINGYHTTWLDDVMYLASERWVWIPLYILVIALIAQQYKMQSIYILLTLGLVMILSDQISASVIKPFVARLRPSHNPLLEGKLHFINGYRGGTYGFVSSHAANVFAFAFFLFFLRMKIVDWKIVLIFLWAAFVSYSRIYLGVHYPSDIFGGMLLGFLISFLIITLYHKTELGMKLVI